MTIFAHPQEMSVAEATQRGVAGIVTEAERGADLVVTRHRRPVAAVIAYHRLEELSKAAEDLHDLALVLARKVTDTGERTSLDDVLRAFGHTRESLEALPDE
jgi:antitoxin (DNA-binding transcriptional repressor) of toxin-antitoxin stability system